MPDPKTEPESQGKPQEEPTTPPPAPIPEPDIELPEDPDTVIVTEGIDPKELFKK